MTLVKLRLNKDAAHEAHGSGGGCGGGCSSEAGHDLSILEEHADGRGARRDFLKNAMTFTLGGATLTVLGGLETGCSAPGEHVDPHKKAAPGQAIFGFLIDTQRCAGTGKCLTACRAENKVPIGVSRTWVERYVHLKDGTIKVDAVPELGYNATEGEAQYDPADVERAYFVPKLCNQCHDAPCNQVCPTHASLKSPEGVELVDPNQCIGCAYCVQACPYGIRFINPDTGTADKCDWCYHRTTQGENPACVEACPTGARLFGRLDDPNSEISKRLAKVPTSVLKEHLGTHPVLKYIGLPGEVI
jgi:Fe-S-cluster-containing dehydrogenase component